MHLYVCSFWVSFLYVQERCASFSLSQLSESVQDSWESSVPVEEVKLVFKGSWSMHKWEGGVQACALRGFVDSRLWGSGF